MGKRTFTDTTKQQLIVQTKFFPYTRGRKNILWISFENKVYPSIEFSSPRKVRQIAQTLLQAADWMEGK